jgi:hypothetical protein
MRSVSASMGVETAIMVSCFLLRSGSGPPADHAGATGVPVERFDFGVSAYVFDDAGLFGAEYSAPVGKNPCTRVTLQGRRSLRGRANYGSQRLSTSPSE